MRRGAAQALSQLVEVGDEYVLYSLFGSTLGSEEGSSSVVGTLANEDTEMSSLRLCASWRTQTSTFGLALSLTKYWNRVINFRGGRLDLFVTGVIFGWEHALRTCCCVAKRQVFGASETSPDANE